MSDYSLVTAIQPLRYLNFMTCKIITFANQKGGSGKTTVCMQIAGELEYRGHSVLVLDADPQGTATRWAESASNVAAFPARVEAAAISGGSISGDLEVYRNRFNFILVDCPPAVESVVPQTALLNSDLVVVPLIPSPTDLWAAVGIRELIRTIQFSNPRLRARLLTNMCQHRTLVTREIIDLLDEFGIAKLETQIFMRTAYRQSALFGTTVSYMGMSAEKARDEIVNVVNEILEILP